MNKNLTSQMMPIFWSINLCVLYVTAIVLAGANSMYYFMSNIFHIEFPLTAIKIFGFTISLPSIILGLRHLYIKRLSTSAITSKNTYWVIILFFIVCAINLFILFSFYIYIEGQLFIFSGIAIVLISLVLTMYYKDDIIIHFKSFYSFLQKSKQSTYSEMINCLLRNPLFSIMQIIIFILLIVSLCMHLIFGGFYNSSTVWFVVVLCSFISLSKMYNDKFADILKISLYITLLVMILITILAIIYKADFYFGDDQQFLAAFNSGQHFLHPEKSFLSGRFHPMYEMLSAIPILFTKLYYKAIIYYIENVILFLLIVIFVYFNLKKYITSRDNNILIPLILLFILNLPEAFSRLFTDIIFHGVGVLFFLSIFLLLLNRAHKNPTYMNYTVAIIPCIFATYSKESVFVIGLCIGLCTLIFNYKGASKQLKYFNVLCVINSAIFIILYLFFAYHSKNYATVHAVKDTYINIIKQINRNTYYLFVLPLLFALYRLYAIIVKRDKSLLHHDVVLFSGFAYGLTFVVLRFEYTYYQVPALFIIYIMMGIYLLYYANKYTSSIKQFTFNTILSILIILQIILFIPSIQALSHTICPNDYLP